MTAKEARKLIGKPVRYKNLKGWNPGHWYEGILEDVQWKNVQIQGNWLWLPDLIIAEVQP